MWRTVWAVVGVAALAAGCAGGTGGTGDDAAPQAGAGECPAWTSPDEPGDAGQDRPALGLGTVAAMDTESGKVVVLPPDSPRTWVLDVCTNTWQRQADVPSAASGPGGVPVYDPVDDVVLMVQVTGPPTAAWAYSVEQDTWTERPAGAGVEPRDGDAGPYGYTIGAAALDPQDRLLYVVRQGELFAYDIAAGRWRSVEVQGERPPVYAPFTLLAFDTRERVLVLAVLGWQHVDPVLPPAQTWLFDVDAGTWDRVAEGPPELGVGYFAWGGEMTYEPVSDRVVAISDGRVVVFDTGSREWAVAPTEDWGVEQWDHIGMPWRRPVGPQSRMNAWLVADPINGRVLVLGGDYWGPGERPERSGDGEPLHGWWGAGTEVIAYDVTRNAWVEIVPPAG